MRARDTSRSPVEEPRAARQVTWRSCERPPRPNRGGINGPKADPLDEEVYERETPNAMTAVRHIALPTVIGGADVMRPRAISFGPATAMVGASPRPLLFA